MARGSNPSINITAEVDQALAQLRKIQRELKQSGSEAEKAEKRSLGFGSALAGIAIGAGVSKAIGEFEEAQTTAAQTEAVIRSTGNAAEVTAEQQDKMVEALSRLAAVDDEVVAGGANLLRTFTSVKGQAFEPALASALDLSAAMGKDLNSSVVLVGKALNDPIRGLGQLSRAGIQFSDDQKAMIRSLVESGDKLGAQKVILAELETQFGGSAEANATSSAKMKVAFDDAAESLGASLAPGLTLVAAGAEKASAAFQAMPEPVRAAAVAGVGLAIVGPKIVDGIGSAAGAVKRLTEAAAAAPGRLGTMVDKMGGAGAVAPLAGTAVAGLGAAAYVMGKKAADAAQRAAELAEGVSSIRDEAERTGKSLEQAFTDTVLLQWLEKNGSALADAGVSIDDLREAVTSGGQAMDDFANRVLANGGDKAVWWANQLNYLGGSLAGAKSETDNHKDAVTALGIAEDNAAGSTDDLTDATERAAKGFYDAGSAADIAGGQIGRWASAVANIGGLHAAQEDLADAMLAEADAAGTVESATDSLASARESEASAREQQVQAGRDLSDALRSEQDAIEAVGDAVETMHDREQSLADARRAAAGDSDEMRDALERLAEAEQSVTEAQQSAAEAQQTLDDVRSNYGRTLAGLADDATLAEIGVRDAQRALDEALARQANPQEGDNAGELADRVTRAQIALRRAQDDAAQAQADLNRNQANGVEGSDAYIDAAENVADANDNVTDAMGRREDAATNVADTQEDADQRVEDAERDLADAVDGVREAEQRRLDQHQAVLDARAKIAAAARDVRDAESETAARLADVRKAEGELNGKAGETAAARKVVEDAENRVAGKTQAHADALFNTNKNAKDLTSTLNTQLYPALQTVLGLLNGNPAGAAIVGGQHAPNEGNVRSATTKGGIGTKDGAKPTGAVSDWEQMLIVAAIEHMKAGDFDEWIVALANLFSGKSDPNGHGPSWGKPARPGAATTSTAGTPWVVGEPFDWGKEWAAYTGRAGAMNYDPNIKPPTRRAQDGGMTVEMNFHGVKDMGALWDEATRRGARAIRARGPRR